MRRATVWCCSAALLAAALRTEELVVSRSNGASTVDSCHPDASDMCPLSATDFAAYSLVRHRSVFTYHHSTLTTHARTRMRTRTCVGMSPHPTTLGGGVQALSTVGLFLSPAGQWACEDNDYCGARFWQSGGACARMDCAARRAADPGFCAKRFNGCARTCGCARGGASHRVSALVPDGHRRGDTQAALVLWLHGYTGEAAWARAMWKLDRLVDAHNVIVAAPNGAVDDMGFPYWDGGSSFHGIFKRQVGGGGGGGGGGAPYNASANRDERHLLRVLDALQERYGVDAARIYLAGSANGAVMAYHMACHHAHRFAGLLVHGASQDRYDIQRCRPTMPLHILHVQCGADHFDRFAAPELQVRSPAPSLR